MTAFINIADLKDPHDPQGRTYRQINAAKTHAIPVGSLVEIIPDPEEPSYDGVRLYVVFHHRDCDETPLYALSWDREDTVQENPRFHNRKWLHGMPEYSLRVVREDAKQ